MSKVSIISFILVLSFLLVSCSGNKEEGGEVAHSSKSTRLFQGVWLDNETDMVIFKVEGDTLYYPESSHVPAYYKIIKDSLVIYGSETSHYLIEKQTEYEFWLHSLNDQIVKLYKSENDNDSIYFINKTPQVLTSIVSEFVQRDSILTYGGKRYRGYTFINPSTRKVYATSYSEEGLSMENVYYDNVIHVCVYHEKNKLFAQDIVKDQFSDVIPADFLRRAILADMRFSAVTNKGYYYIATLCIPDGTICYAVEVEIDYNDNLTFTLLD